MVRRPDLARLYRSRSPHPPKTWPDAKRIRPRAIKGENFWVWEAAGKASGGGVQAEVEGHAATVKATRTRKPRQPVEAEPMRDE